MLQLESYKNERYLSWMKKNPSKLFSWKEAIVWIAINILFFFQKEIALLVAVILIGIIFITQKPVEEKKPIVFTNRVKRMYITFTLLFAILWGIGNLLLAYPSFWGVLLITEIISLASCSFVYFINGINQPIEKAIQRKYYRAAERKLKDNPNLKIIGITGSYGKTSTKHIITAILQQKYQVLMTPESYNTTLGVVKTINENLTALHQVFVCEMGAKNIGDIKEICDLVHPSMGILTAIGPQHLETFKTIENVKKTKMELVDCLPAEGVAFLNYENENIVEANHAKNYIRYGFSEEFEYHADHIEITENGSEFDIHMPENNKIHVKTKLLGQHNILNILVAVAVAKELGLTDEQVKMGILSLKPVTHRLELRKNANGSIIIDDAYNSNREGAKKALEVLSKFQNRTKILVTPGIVDLGEYTEQYNQELGEYAASHCDYAILVGEKQAIPILKGLQERNFKEEHIYVAKDLKDAMIKMREWMDASAVVLLENDLPDNYL